MVACALSFAVIAGPNSESAGSHERKTTLPKTLRPIDIIADIESRRVKLGINKQTLAKRAGIIPEMLSYLLRRGRQGRDLPVDCLGKVQKALRESKEARP